MKVDPIWCDEEGLLINNPQCAIIPSIHVEMESFQSVWKEKLTEDWEDWAHIYGDAIFDLQRKRPGETEMPNTAAALRGRAARIAGLLRESQPVLAGPGRTARGSSNKPQAREGGPASAQGHKA